MEYVVAIDIGGTNIKYALVDRLGKIVYESLKPARQVNEGFGLITCLKNIITEVSDYAYSSKLPVIGIGIGVPSIVDNGVVLFANNIPELDHQNLKQIIEDFVHLPVFVDNDANLMGLGEVKYGETKNISDAVFLTVGTGIGGALILNGKLYNGYRDRGAELGHLIINSEGRICSCGASGCLEAYASINVLIAEYQHLRSPKQRHLSTEIDGKYIVARYKENQWEAVAAMENHFRYMATGIVSLINIFAPQQVIIGGGISESGDYYINNIRQLVNASVMKETSCFTTIVRASLGNKAGFLGASALVFNYISATDEEK